jgi:molybdate transport system substrate-binding protein
MMGFTISAVKTASTLALTLLIAIATPQAFAQAPGSASQVKVADAKPGDVRIIASNGIREFLEAVRGQAEKAVGHPLIMQYGASKDLKSTIDSGQPFEVTIITPDVLDGVTAEGKVVAGSRVDLARVLIGIGQRGDAPKSDISTSAALKKTLLKAKSIRGTQNGASFPATVKMFEGLGLADTIKPKLNMPGDVQLAPGEYELSFTLVSELLSQKNLVFLGPILPEFNVPAVMSAGIGSSGDEKAAKALIKFLQSPALDPVLKEKGMQR